MTQVLRLQRTSTYFIHHHLDGPLRDWLAPWDLEITSGNTINIPNRSCYTSTIAPRLSIAGRQSRLHYTNSDPRCPSSLRPTPRSIIVVAFILISVDCHAQRASRKHPRWCTNDVRQLGSRDMCAGLMLAQQFTRHFARSRRCERVTKTVTT